MMHVSRRKAIRNLVIITGGVCLLPSCLHEEKKSTVPLKKISLSQSEEDLLADIGETIIPATDTPGAKDLSLHLFTLKMIDDCYEADQQQKFVKGLKEMNAISRKKFDKDFSACTSPQREEILMDIENKKGFSEDVSSFYSLAKNLTIRGYMNSKYVMTKLVVYELVPGRFHGSFPV